MNYLRKYFKIRFFHCFNLIWPKMIILDVYRKIKFWNVFMIFLWLGLDKFEVTAERAHGYGLICESIGQNEAHAVHAIDHIGDRKGHVDFVQIAVYLTATLGFTYETPELVDEQVGRVAIPNRVMSYICSGLPVIVDTRAEFTASMISAYNAGVLVDPASPNDLERKLRSADITALRQGTAELKQALIQQNQQQLKKLQSVIFTS